MFRMPMKSETWKMELMAFTWLEICRDNRWDDVSWVSFQFFLSVSDSHLVKIGCLLEKEPPPYCRSICGRDGRSG